MCYQLLPGPAKRFTCCEGAAFVIALVDFLFRKGLLQCYKTCLFIRWSSIPAEAESEAEQKAVIDDVYVLSILNNR